MSEKATASGQAGNREVSKMRRICWKIERGAGHGSWVDFPAASLKSTIGELNREYGTGTHWIEEGVQHESETELPSALTPAP